MIQIIAQHLVIALANVKATAQPSNARGSAMGVSLDAAIFYNSTACPAHWRNRQ